MKRITSIKNLFLLLLITVTLSCNSDDSSDLPIEEEDNRLVLKRITSNRDFRLEFNISGRWISSTANESNINESRVNNIINNQDQLVKRTIENGGLQRTTEYQYDSSGKIIQTIKIIFSNGSTTEIATQFSYNNNVITATNTESNEDYQYTFTFTDDSYMEISNFKATNLTSGEDFFEETYLYINDNFKKTTIITSTTEQPPYAFKTYEYDETINPWAAGNRVDYLNELFSVTSKNTGSLTTILVRHSKNNRLTSHIEDQTISVEYNEQGYISKETDSPNSDNSGFEPSIINFEYY